MTISNKYWLLLAFTFALFLGLRLHSLGNDISNSDAARWHRRSIKFLEAIKTANYKETYQHYQPGVTLMWLDAINFQLNKSWPYLENSDEYVKINRQTQQLITFTLFALLLLQTQLLRIMYGKRISLLYSFFIATEPYLLGIDRWVHLTSLETYFGFTAMLAFFVYINKKNPLLAILSGGLLALAVLSKLTSLIFAVFIIITCVVILRKRAIKPLLTIFTSFILVFVLLFPAFGAAPLEVGTNLLIAVTKAVGEDIRGQYFTGFKSLFYYPIILFFKLSAVTLFLAIMSLTNKKSPLWLKVFFSLLLVVLTLADKKIDRYSIILFPSIVLLAVFALNQLNTKLIALLLVTHFFILVFGIYKYSPVYSAFYSPISGSEQIALKTGFYENSGEYFAQAAMYLNTKPRDEVVFIPNNYEAFSYFHKGKRTREFSPQVNYVVESVDFDRPISVGTYCNKLEKTFGPKGIPVVFVYSCQEVKPNPIS